MVLIYVNKNQESTKASMVLKLKNAFERENIKYQVITESDFDKKINAEAIFVLGGDGTVLYVSHFACKNQIPIIGINAGKLGFLSEFESYEIEKAVNAFKDGQLNREEKICLSICCEDKNFFALNDVFIQKAYSDDISSLVLDATVNVDGIDVCQIIGDGVVVSTPTGSTAYSLSAGGSVMSPGVNAFSITPLAAHSLNLRPIICSSNSDIRVTVNGDLPANVFADCARIGKLEKGQSFTVKKFNLPTIFLRKNNYNFFNRLVKKFTSNGEQK